MNCTITRLFTILDNYLEDKRDNNKFKIWFFNRTQYKYKDLEKCLELLEIKEAIKIKDYVFYDLSDKILVRDKETDMVLVFSPNEKMEDLEDYRENNLKCCYWCMSYDSLNNKCDLNNRSEEVSPLGYCNFYIKDE